LLAKFNGKFSSATDEQARVNGYSRVEANVDFVDPANKIFNVDVRDPIPIHLFHQGRPRQFRARLSFSDDDASAHGQLSYVVGKRETRTRYQREIVCTRIQ
jgi:hypothetical protein